MIMASNTSSTGIYYRALCLATILAALLFSVTEQRRQLNLRSSNRMSNKEERSGDISAEADNNNNGYITSSTTRTTTRRPITTTTTRRHNIVRPTGGAIRSDWRRREGLRPFDHRYAVRKLEGEMIVRKLNCDNVLQMVVDDDDCDPAKEAYRHMCFVFCPDNYIAYMDSVETCSEFVNSAIVINA